MPDILLSATTIFSKHLDAGIPEGDGSRESIFAEVEGLWPQACSALEPGKFNLR